MPTTAPWSRRVSEVRRTRSACASSRTSSSVTAGARSSSGRADRKSTRLNSSHANISYAVFFFNDTATTEIYTLSLHDALPIFCTAVTQLCMSMLWPRLNAGAHADDRTVVATSVGGEAHEIGVRIVADLLKRDGWRTFFLGASRSEEHTSELQSRQYLVCRLFL